MNRKGEYRWMVIPLRLIGLPFFMIFALIGVIRLWIIWVLNFIRFGGEAISYTKNAQRKTILDVFEKVQEGLEQKELLDKYRSVLLKVEEAYQGVGDFEGTGENMVSVINDVKKVL